MTQSNSSRGAILSLAVFVFACGEDTAPSHGTEATPASTPSVSAAGAGPSEHANTAAPEQAEPGDRGKDGVVDGDMAAVLDRFPADMRPDDLLPELQKKMVVPEFENNALALFSDIVSVPAGADLTFCTYTRFITTKTIYAHDSTGVQTDFGHHAILMYTLEPQPPGTHECARQEQQQNQIITGSAAEGNGGIVLGPNVVSEIPVGAQIIINHHWINSSEHEVQAQAEVTTIPPPEGTTDLIVARAFNLISTHFDIPAHASGQASVECELDHDVTLVTAAGHEHEWGTHVKGERLGANPDVLFDHDYHEEMVNHPMIRYFSTDSPYNFRRGDRVRMSCEWSNTTDKPLSFPAEMCVFFAWQIGAERDSGCFDGKWL